MLIWGSGSGVCIAGEAGMRDCPVCGSAQRFDLSVSYGYAHIWYLFSWVTRRKYLSVCSRCHNGIVLSKREFRDRVPKDPIPFMRRRGWLLLPVIVGLVLALGATRERYRDDSGTASVATLPVAGTQAIASASSGDADELSLAADYRRAVMQAIQRNWMRPDNTPPSPCKVRVTQQPGGHVTSVDIEPDCPYDEAGKRSLIHAVQRAEPLPYPGYEKVFNPTIVITFAAMPDASSP
jgi:hypothetical protein